MEDISLPARCERSLAMVKTRYAKDDPNHMAEVGPAGPDGQEIPVSLVYDQVALAAKYSQQDCKLDNLFDGIEESTASQYDYVILHGLVYFLAILKIICHGGPFRFSPRIRQSGVYLNTHTVMKNGACVETRHRGHKCMNRQVPN